MSLRYVIGSEGSGLTEWMYREMLRQSAENPDCSVYYFVPDQATLQAQKDLVQRQENGCVMNIDILSFGRLRHRLTEELGDCFPPVLSDIGKSMVLKKVLLETDSELSLYATKHKKPGFVSEMKSMISELQRYLVDAGTLSELSGKEEDPILKDKLHDLSVILARFRETLGDRFLTEEDIYSAMCGPVERSEKLRGGILFLNGFTGFTPSQFLLLRSLLRVCSNMTVALTMDAALYGKTIPSNSLFHMTANTLAKLGAIAEEEHIDTEKPVLLPNAEGEDALSFVRNHIFRRDGAVYRNDRHNLIVRSAANRTEELRFFITEAERLVRERGCRYREIGVVIGDVQAYSQELFEMTEAVGIPCFIDYKTDVVNNPLVDFIRSALRVLASDFRADTVTHYLKNRLSGYEDDDVCRTENYILAKGIRGFSAYKKPFRYRYRTRHIDPVTVADRVREQLVSDLSPLREGLASAPNVKASVRVLYDFVVKHDCFEKMNALAESAALGKDRRIRRKETEYRRIYQSVLDLFDHMDELMGDLQLTLSEFADVLDAGFREMKLGMIPPEQDSVTVGDVKRSRLSGIRYLFFLGMNDGVVPNLKSGSGILTEKEREMLQGCTLELSETPKDALSTEEFYLYLACAKPTDGLFLSYSRSGNAGREAKPSYVIYRILGLLPKLSITDEKSSRSVFADVAPDRGRREYLRTLLGEGEPSENGETIAEWFASDEGREFLPEAEELLKQAEEETGSAESISADLSARLYGQRLTGGITMLENYASCAYRTFLERGLRLEDLPEYAPNALDQGTFLHDAIRRYEEAVVKSGTTFRKITPEQSEELMEGVISEMMGEESQEIYQASSRFRYIAHCLRKTLHRMTEVLRMQLTPGRFEPEAFEKEFTFVSEHMELRGKIDRVDSYAEDGNKYIKIVDYKSSGKEMDYGDIYEGLQAQLPVYMKEIVRESTENVPAAMLYSSLADPYVDGNTEEETEENRRKEARPDGVVLEDDTVICGLDNRFLSGDNYASEVIPVERKNSEYKKTLKPEEMEKLLDYAEKRMFREAEEILSGNIRKNPCDFGNRNTSCSFCPFRALCTDVGEGKERKLRTIPKMKKEEFFAKITEEEQCN